MGRRKVALNENQGGTVISFIDHKFSIDYLSLNK